MLKAGVPKDVVRQKMLQEGFDASILDYDLNLKVPINEEQPTGDEKVPVSEHPLYAKFFKMLKIGLPKGAVKVKMTQEGLNPDFLDKAPNELVSIKEEDGSKGIKASNSTVTTIATEESTKIKDESKNKMIAAGEHPKYGKFFKMLKVGIPLAAVKAKVNLEGLNSDVMDKSSDELIPLDDDSKDDKTKKDGGDGDSKMVKVSEHPKYVKFFKMLKIGLPVGAVKVKVSAEGLNPDMMDKGSDDMIPLDDDN